MVVPVGLVLAYWYTFALASKHAYRTVDKLLVLHYRTDTETTHCSFYLSHKGSSVKNKLLSKSIAIFISKKIPFHFYHFQVSTCYKFYIPGIIKAFHIFSHFMVNECMQDMRFCCLTNGKLLVFFHLIYWSHHDSYHNIKHCCNRYQQTSAAESNRGCCVSAYNVSHHLDLWGHISSYHNKALFWLQWKKSQNKTKIIKLKIVNIFQQIFL